MAFSVYEASQYYDNSKTYWCYFFSFLLACVSYTKYLKKSDNVKLHAHVNRQSNEYYCMRCTSNL